MVMECNVKKYQGHRWVFKLKDFYGTIDMIDTYGEFPTVEITPEMADVLSKQLGMLQEYQKRDKNNLMVANLILDFVRENKDIDKDIIVALIENIDDWIEGGSFR